MSEDKHPFWKHKTLEEMTPSEWEAVCDGCARCCLLKLEDEDTGKLHLTRLACALLDQRQCRCSDYPNRFKRMKDCIAVTPEKIEQLAWMPDSCAYRLLANGGELAWWHPLVSGRADSVHEAGISVRGWTKSEKGVSEDDMERYIIRSYPKAK